MKNRKFKLCRLVRENDGRYRVYWNTVNPDGTTKNNKRRVRDRKEGLEKCRMLEEELSRKGLNEEMPVSPEDRIMMEKFYKTSPSISLAEFIRRYMGCVSHPRQGRTVRGLHAEWKKHRLLTSPNRENLRMTLARVRLFKEAFGNRIVSAIRKEEAEQWLFGLDVAEKTRQHYRSAVISFFKWCDIDMSGIKCPRAVHPEPGTYTVDEAAQILHYTKTHRKNMLAPLAIAMFCGVRLSEFAYITWEELDLSHPDEDGDFYLAGGKTGRRIVHLPSVAKKWLLACERRHGLVFDFSRCKIHADRIYDAFRRIIPGHVEAKQNGFRHSYCTYKVTCFGNMSDVADEMGNSIQMIRKHYYRPTRKKDAGLYWKLTPEYVDSIFA
ncbi:tyrosine-type recombinase/integrase [Akkermansia glycaniphila]|uniref:Phage integrase family n=1 Tax=Akkermansia glycaniphila TaxID=1679444 RepID=A0A1C7PAY9_9BACT|nr:tyrosine-type recombinase/integrase [Akkermansia glycaniphila]OCA02750.1 hypothetical protein AC781_08650 [Akkermansia glycaniphila]SEH99828.1 phage integrase family [Akkermansia glycaniphila]